MFENHVDVALMDTVSGHSGNELTDLLLEVVCNINGSMSEDNVGYLTGLVSLVMLICSDPLTMTLKIALCLRFR